MVRGLYVVFTINFLFLYLIHRYTGGGTTTDAALRYARQNMFVRKHGMRKGVAAEIAIVITDGKNHTSSVVRKLAFLHMRKQRRRSAAKLISALVFATHVIYTIPLLLKSKISSL